MVKLFQQILDWISNNKELLTLLFGSGILVAIASGFYKLASLFIKNGRALKLRAESSPFVVLPPNSQLSKSILGGDDNDYLADRNIPYQHRSQGKNIRLELEKILQETRYLLILGHTGFGKTREALNLAQSLCNEGWTILYLKNSGWLEAPARLPDGIPDRKLLFFLDDLNRKAYRGRIEQSPKAANPFSPLTVPFQERLYDTLKMYEALCGKGEIYVIATARDERFSEYSDEPSEWDKLEFEKYADLWNCFNLYNLPEPDNSALTGLLSQVTTRVNIRVDHADFNDFVKKNDGTFANLVENLRGVHNENLVLNLENFRDTLKGTWQWRYSTTTKKLPFAKYVYDAVELLRNLEIDLDLSIVSITARIIAGGTLFGRITNYFLAPIVTTKLIQEENILRPRDGQIEAKGYRINQNIYLPSLYLYLWSSLSENLSHDASFFTKYGKKNAFASAYTRAIRKFEMSTLLFLLRFDFRGKGIFHAYILNSLAALNFFLGKERQAIYFSDLILENNLQESTDLSQLAFFYRKAGDKTTDKKESLALYDKASKLDPTDIYAFQAMARLYKDMGQIEESIATFRKAITLDPNNIYAIHQMAHLYINMGKIEDGIAAFRRAIALDPTSAWGVSCLGTTYSSLGRLDDAFHLLNKAIELNPKEASLWAGLAVSYRIAGKMDETIAAYKHSLALDNGQAYVWTELSRIYRIQGYIDLAISSAMKAIEVQSDYPFSYVALSICYRKIGLSDEADIQIQTAAKFIGKESIYNRACFHAMCGNLDEAMNLLSTALLTYQESRQWAMVDLGLENLHNDPRFQSLVNNERT